MGPKICLTGSLRVRSGDASPGESELRTFQVQVRTILKIASRTPCRFYDGSSGLFHFKLSAKGGTRALRMFICETIRRWPRRRIVLVGILSFIIISGYTRHWATASQPRCTA